MFLLVVVYALYCSMDWVCVVTTQWYCILIRQVVAAYFSVWITNQRPMINDQHCRITENVRNYFYKNAVIVKS